jgi:hypothetical protein
MLARFSKVFSVHHCEPAMLSAQLIPLMIALPAMSLNVVLVIFADPFARIAARELPT